MNEFALAQGFVGAGTKMLGKLGHAAIEGKGCSCLEVPGINRKYISLRLELGKGEEMKIGSRTVFVKERLAEGISA